MLWTVSVVLIVLWAFGLVSHTRSGFIHTLLIVALIMIMVGIIRRQGVRR